MSLKAFGILFSLFYDAYDVSTFQIRQRELQFKQNIQEAFKKVKISEKSDPAEALKTAKLHKNCRL
jgi:hypothetical protein